MQKEQWPEVTVVISAFNEARNIEQKLGSLAALDYPSDRLRVLLVDDGSRDGTAEIAKGLQLPWLDVIQLEHNSGKPVALNTAMLRVDTEFCVYMDARQRVSSNALKALIAHFDDAQVGAVSGELMIVDENNPEQVNVGLYWRYEKALREMESRLYSTAGATGALYAIRTELFRPLDQDAILDDFDTPVNVLKAGKRVVFEPGAQVFDSSQSSLDDEFKRKLRTLTGNFQSFAHHPWLFSPAKNAIWWQFLSHKVFRLLVPWALLLLLPASYFAGGWWWGLVFVGQLVFYSLAIAAGTLDILRQNKLVSFAQTFVQLNLAAWLAALRYLRGDVSARWKT
ncbi:MAG: glycosyltransferase family 2 protein [Granulosicoccaceae bacterium]